MHFYVRLLNCFFVGRIDGSADTAQDCIVLVIGQFKQVLFKLLESCIVHYHKIKHFFQLFGTFCLVNKSLQVLTGLIGDLFHQDAAENGHGKLFGGAFVLIVFAVNAEHFCRDDLDCTVF